jgi:[acyl-carrier-protein] S-malonyltransferase
VKIDEIGLLLPGQGSQFVGMGRDLAERFPRARETFEEADEALGFALSRLCWDGPEDELLRTSNAQPAILVHSVAVWRLVHDHAPAVAVAAGHSLGEFSAYVAAGSIGFVDAVRVVRKRGELMFESGQQRPGSMAAVLGLDEETVERVCTEASSESGGIVQPANFNSHGQVVISGDVAAVQQASQAARAAGAKRVLPLNVSGAFHSPLMKVAERGLADRLAQVEFRDPAFAVVSNVSGEPVRKASEARRLLVEQLTAPVRWTHCVHTMVAQGTTSYLEIGPGNVLSNLTRRIEQGAHTRAIGTADQVEAFLSSEVNQWN